MENQLDIKGETLTNNKDIAESFDNFFSNIGPNLSSKIGTTDDNFVSYIKNTKSEFAAFHPTTIGSVYKATGTDKISSKIIKIAAPVISDSVTHIFNQSIAQSFFPDEWKIARVVPLFKSGERNLSENYRPISVLPVIRKILERIMYDQLYKYLTEAGILSDCQFGFRKSHSTTAALLDCTNDWYVNIGRKLFNVV